MRREMSGHHDTQSNGHNGDMVRVCHEMDEGCTIMHGVLEARQVGTIYIDHRLNVQDIDLTHALSLHHCKSCTAPLWWMARRNGVMAANIPPRKTCRREPLAQDTRWSGARVEHKRNPSRERFVRAASNDDQATCSELCGGAGEAHSTPCQPVSACQLSSRWCDPAPTYNSPTATLGLLTHTHRQLLSQHAFLRSSPKK